MHYVVAYDICNPHRLRRVARVMEKYAIRTQKSVFIFEGSRRTLGKVLDELSSIMRIREGDIVQAWPVASGTPPTGVFRGHVPCLFPSVVLIDDGQLSLLEDDPCEFPTRA